MKSYSTLAFVNGACMLNGGEVLITHPSIQVALISHQQVSRVCINQYANESACKQASDVSDVSDVSDASDVSIKMFESTKGPAAFSKLQWSLPALHVRGQSTGWS